MLLIASQISFQRMRPPEIEEGDSPQGPVDVVDGQTTVTESVVAEEVADVLPETVEVAEETVPVDIDAVNELIAEAVQELREKESQEIHVEPEAEPDPEVREAKGEYVYDDDELASDNSPDLRPLTTQIETYNIYPKEDTEYTNSFKKPEGYVQNEEQAESNLWAKTTGKQ
jgi:hypothetical protein